MVIQPLVRCSSPALASSREGERGKINTIMVTRPTGRRPPYVKLKLGAVQVGAKQSLLREGSGRERLCDAHKALGVERQTQPKRRRCCA